FDFRMEFAAVGLIAQFGDRLALADDVVRVDFVLVTRRVEVMDRVAADFALLRAAGAAFADGFRLGAQEGVERVLAGPGDDRGEDDLGDPFGTADRAFQLDVHVLAGAQQFADARRRRLARAFLEDGRFAGRIGRAVDPADLQRFTAQVPDVVAETARARGRREGHRHRQSRAEYSQRQSRPRPS